MFEDIVFLSDYLDFDLIIKLMKHLCTAVLLKTFKIYRVSPKMCL